MAPNPRHNNRCPERDWMNKLEGENEKTSIDLKEFQENHQSNVDANRKYYMKIIITVGLVLLGSAAGLFMRVDSAEKALKNSTDNFVDKTIFVEHKIELVNTQSKVIYLEKEVSEIKNDMQNIRRILTNQAVEQRESTQKILDAIKDVK